MDDKPFRLVHYLKGSKMTSVPRRIVAFACDHKTVVDNENGLNRWLQFESCSMSLIVHDAKHGGMVDNHFTTDKRNAVEMLCNWSSPKLTTWYVSQNLARDLTLIDWWDQIDRKHFSWHRAIKGPNTRSGKGEGSDGFRNGFIATQDPPVIIVGFWHGRKVVFVDSKNLCLATVEDWRPSLDKVEILVASIIGYVDWILRNDMGVMRYTASSQAYESYKHKFMKHKVCVHGNKAACDLERKAYFGGRTELFYRGSVYNTSVKPDTDRVLPEDLPVTGTDGPIYKLDVQGLFPSVMRGNQFPTKLVSLSAMSSQKKVSAPIKAVIATVRLATRRNLYPCRDAESGKVIYPTGEFVTTLCGEDLEAANLKGEFWHCGMIAEYETAELFTDYVDWFWSMRQDARKAGDDESETIAKQFLTGLYGKFGQKSARWEDRSEIRSPVRWGNWWKHGMDTNRPDLFRSLGYNTQELVEGGETRESFPAVAAFVTMYARRRMDRLREIAGPRNVYLQVVDALYVSHDGYRLLYEAGEIKDGELGKLRLVGMENYGVFWSANDLTFGSEEVIAGIKFDRTKVAKHRYKVTQETRLQTILEGDPRRGVRVYDVVKELNRENPPGNVGPDGWIKPPHLEEV